MGGHNAGEVASHVASDAIFDFIAERNGDKHWPFGRDPFLSETGNVVRTAVHIANVRVLEAAGVSDEYAGMGTTAATTVVPMPAYSSEDRKSTRLNSSHVKIS